MPQVRSLLDPRHHEDRANSGHNPQQRQPDAVGGCAGGHVERRPIRQGALRHPQRFVHRLGVPRRRPVVIGREDVNRPRPARLFTRASRPGDSYPSSFVIRMCDGILCVFELNRAASGRACVAAGRATQRAARGRPHLRPAATGSARRSRGRLHRSAPRSRRHSGKANDVFFGSFGLCITRIVTGLLVASLPCG